MDRCTERFGLVITMASIRKRTSRSGHVGWQVRWWMPDGTQRSRTFETRRAATAFAAERDREQSAGRERFDPRAGRVTMATMYDRWAASARPNLRPKTWESYSDHWRKRIEPALGRYEARHVTREVVERWADTLTIGASGQRSAHLVLRAILDRAVEDGAIAANLARRVPLPRVPHREHHRYLTAEQVQELASALGPQGDVVTLLAYTGLRWGELVGLRVEDVDLTRRRLRVVRSVTPVAGKPIEGPPKSRAGRRTVPIAGPAARVLSARLAGRDGMVPAVTSPSGGMLSVTNWRQQTKWNVTLKGLGLDGLRPHDLRHTYASLARSAGADLKLLQATMGHSSITVTAHTYADLYDNELDAVADALDRLMNPEDDSQRGPSVAAIETLPLFN